MRRILSFLEEWLEKRKRVTDEVRFHIEQSEASWVTAGLSKREARRTAWRRFGKSKARRRALREAGGGVGGLVGLFHAHQVSASAWAGPICGALVVGVLLALSPNCLLLLQSVAGNGKVTHQALVMGPAQAIWIGVGALALLLSVGVLKNGTSRNWIAYGAVLLCLHALVSLMAWGVTMQLWNRIRWRNDGWAVVTFITVYGIYAAASWLQCRTWWRDLRRRCPLCLERMRLPLTEGTPDRVLLGSSSTEWVCIHGHGVLRENRWSRSFRPEQSSLERLISA
jgi:hypothetical protein